MQDFDDFHGWTTDTIDHTVPKPPGDVKSQAGAVDSPAEGGEIRDQLCRSLDLRQDRICCGRVPNAKIVVLAAQAFDCPT